MQFGHARPEFDRSQYLEVTRTEQWSKRLPAKHVLFLIDACNSGLGFDAQEPTVDQELLTQFSGDGSRNVLTAGTGTEKAFQVDQGNQQGYGVFTRAFLNAVRNTSSSSGFLTLSEVVASVERSVGDFNRGTRLQMTPRRWQIPREPGRDKGTFVFVNPTAKRPSLPADLRRYASVIPKDGSAEATEKVAGAPPNSERTATETGRNVGRIPAASRPVRSFADVLAEYVQHARTRFAQYGAAAADARGAWRPAVALPGARECRGSNESSVTWLYCDMTIENPRDESDAERVFRDLVARTQQALSSDWRRKEEPTHNGKLVSFEDDQIRLDIKVYRTDSRSLDKFQSKLEVTLRNISSAALAPEESTEIAPLPRRTLTVGVGTDNPKSIPVPEAIKTVKTDSAGSFAVRVPPGNYEIRASRKGYMSAMALDVRVTGSDGERVEILMKPLERDGGSVVSLSDFRRGRAFPSYIEGIVKDESGRAFEGVVIEVAPRLQ